MIDSAEKRHWLTNSALAASEVGRCSLAQAGERDEGDRVSGREQTLALLDDAVTALKMRDGGRADERRTAPPPLLLISCTMNLHC
jgi:hypothetical protein